MCGVLANGFSRGLGSSTEARIRVRSRGIFRRISRLFGGSSGVIIVIDDGVVF